MRLTKSIIAGVIYTVAVSVCLNVANTWAQESIDLDKMRQELSALRSKAQSSSSNDISDDLARKNAELLEAERALLESAERDLSVTGITDATTAAIDQSKMESLEGHEKVVIKAATALKQDENSTEQTSGKSVIREVGDVDQFLENQIEQQRTGEGTISVDQELRDAQSQIAELAAARDSSRGKVDSLEQSLRKIRTAKASCESKLNKSNPKLQRVVRELNDTKRKLMRAETEVARLSSLIATHVKASISPFKNEKSHTPRMVPALENKPITSEPRVRRPSRTEIANDMPIANVLVNKAYLRTGPGKDNSPLMAVKKGTRLAVETRKGGWYRVVSPTGTRAWIASELVAFASDYKSRPSRTVKIRG